MFTPANALAASTDNDPCYGTGQTCSTSTWEWVQDNNSSSQGANGYISTFNDSRQTNYGNDTFIVGWVSVGPIIPPGPSCVGATGASISLRGFLRLIWTTFRPPRTRPLGSVAFSLLKELRVDLVEPGGIKAKFWLGRTVQVFDLNKEFLFK